MTTTHDDRRRRFEEIWGQHRLQLLAYCVRRVAAPDAEDACAEVFLVVWRRLDRVPYPPETLLYLYGVAGRVLANQHRSTRRRSRLDSRLASLGVTPPDEPIHVVVRSDEVQMVRNALSRLKPRDREIVMLDAWEKLTREQIAGVLGMTRAAVDQSIHRSYRRLGRVLAPTLEYSTMDSPPVAERGGT